jgi:hypothetical protein
MPDGFPNAELRHRFTVEGAASGSVFLDNIFFVQLPQTNDTRWIDIMPLGQSWRYSITAPPTNWATIGFDDSTWPVGTAKFGAGTGPQNIRTPITPDKPAYFFRRTFAMPLQNYSTLLLAATCTDDYGGTVYPLRIWINGKEIVSGGIEAVTGEGNEIKYFDLTPFGQFFIAGQTNTIAVMLQNNWQPDWDNVAFDVGLEGIAATLPSIPAFLSNILNPDGSVTINLTGPANSSWILESFESVSGWSAVQTVTFGASGIAAVADKGQNGRPMPSAASSRLYRLRSN